MNYMRIDKCDCKNGEGYRVVLWVAGCSHNCKGCHNPETHNPSAGSRFTDEQVEKILKILSNDWCSGLTLTGGDPLYVANLDEVKKLVYKVREIYGNKKTVWLWTGYELSELIKIGDKKRLEIIKQCDILVDGKFKEELYDRKLKWRGSSNQKVIDIAKLKLIKLS